jgi:hypothetical protein
MKKVWLILICIILKTQITAQKNQQAFVSTDIDNFWIAYDKINATKDSTEQYHLLKTLYIDKGSLGLKSLIEVRNYKVKEFMNWMTKYPQFWNSLRPNTLKIKTLIPKIDADIQKLKTAYPDLKPATIYFTIGAFRTNGTIQNDRVLIGSEFSLADKSTIVDEFPEWRQTFYKNQNPLNELGLLCTHEYIHTQQKELVEKLLYMCLYEGVAEFISCKVTGKKSVAPAIEFGRANEKAVIEKFILDLFIGDNDYNWLWGENRNELKVRDLGYYIGYEISERYYNLSKDKTKAIKELIELDYSNEKEVERIVDMTRLFPKTVQTLYEDYEKQRPTVLQVLSFENGKQDVKPGMTSITITFSEPLNGINDGIDFGPLGEKYCPMINRQKIWSEDKKSWTFEADLKPDQHYQILISENFRNAKGIRLKPYLVEFKTSK